MIFKDNFFNCSDVVMLPFIEDLASVGERLVNSYNLILASQWNVLTKYVGQIVQIILSRSFIAFIPRYITASLKPHSASHPFCGTCI